MATVPPTTTDFPPEPAPKPLSNFTQLSSQIRLYTPPATAPLSPANAPTTILLCSWMNASLKHISYYTKHYISLYPSARIIVATINTTEFILQSETRRRADDAPAVAALLNGNGEERILVHALSNGGGKRVYGILSCYREKTGKPVPAKTFIFDSAPGIPQFKRDIHALSFPGGKLPWHLWLPFITAVYLMTMFVFVSVHWMPRWWWYELVWGPTDGLRDKRIVDPGTVMGFVYSKEDEAIDWREVESFADGAEGKGYKVVKRRVEGAGHVQMFKGTDWETEEGGYWGWVGRMWELGVNKN